MNDRQLARDAENAQGAISDLITYIEELESEIETKDQLISFIQLKLSDFEYEVADLTQYILDLESQIK